MSGGRGAWGKPPPGVGRGSGNGAGAGRGNGNGSMPQSGPPPPGLGRGNGNGSRQQSGPPPPGLGRGNGNGSMPQSGPPPPGLGRGNGSRQPDGPPPQNSGQPAPQTSRQQNVPTSVPPQQARQSSNGGSQDQPQERRRRVYHDEILTKPSTCVVKQGKEGKPVSLIANYFPLTSKMDWSLYQYRVDILPELDRTSSKKKILRGIRDLNYESYLFDGTVLYTSNRLPEPYEKSVKFEDVNFLIKIRLVGDVSQGDSHYIQVFNILVRKCLEKLGMKLVGRNYYNPANKIIIPQYRLELWPGVLTSIRQCEKQILMCTELSFKVLRDETLLDILIEFTKKSRPGQALNDYKRKVIGEITVTMYGKNKTYRIDDVETSQNPGSTFTMKNGDKITFAQYYQRNYGLRITDMKQPLLLSRAKARDRRAGQAELIYLIPELCKFTGLTDAMRADFRLMSALTDQTRINPAVRIKRLRDFNVGLSQVADVRTTLKDWNFNVDINFVKVPGRVMQNDSVYTNQRKPFPFKDGSWNFCFPEEAQMVSVKLEKWVVIVPQKNRIPDETKTFIQVMIEHSKTMKFPISPPRLVVIPNDYTESYINAITRETNQNSYQLVMIIVPNNKSDRYSDIKKKLCIDRPIASQIVLAKTLTQKNESRMKAVSSKVAIQLNCKLGGFPWAVDIARYSKNLMVVGFDVCHDKSQRGTDFGAMVASTDPNYFGTYYSAVSYHRAGEELSNSLAQNLGCAVQAYYQQNKKLPDEIIVYRDGVGEGDLKHVYEYEVAEMKKVLLRIYENPERVKLAVVIVTKRINTRIFAGTNNPPPGTVVDDIITDPMKYDFFIISQSVNQGTVAPTSYNVIEDTTGYSVSKMQLLTYKLCHMYFNYCGTVRVPGPCQYAHKLAFFVSTALKARPDDSLRNKLYFL